MELEFRLLSLLFLLGALVGHTVAQQLDPDLVDFSTVNGWDDLKACVQYRLDWIAYDVGCSETEGGTYDYQDYTNGCLCRASNLGSAIEIIEEMTMEDCENIDDTNMAKTILVNYCKSKGYTSIVTPVVHVSATGGYTVTATVTQPVTSTITQPVTSTVTSTVTQPVTSTILAGGALTSGALGLSHESGRLYIVAMWPIALIFIPFVCAR